MANSFTSQEINILIADHKKLLDDLSSIQQIRQKYRKNISTYAQELLTAEVLKTLRTISIDEINREKKGFRIKLLKENGYNTIADIANVSAYRISAIYGISTDTARAIKYEVDEIISKTRQVTKIRISADNKTTSSTQLIQAITQYDRCLPFEKESQTLISGFQNVINAEIEKIVPAVHGFKWLFASGAKKRAAQDAYNTLKQLLIENYGTTARKLICDADGLDNISFSEAWNSFDKEPIKFINILESVVPGILGNDDSVYGLPDDLAREIEKQPVYRN